MTDPHRPGMPSGPGQRPQDADDEFVGSDQLTDQLLGEIEDRIVELVDAQIDSNETRIGTGMAWLLRGGPPVATGAIGYLLQIVKSLVNVVAATHCRPPAQVWVEFAKRWNPPGSPEPTHPGTAPGSAGHGRRSLDGADAGATAADRPGPAGAPGVTAPVIAAGAAPGLSDASGTSGPRLGSLPGLDDPTGVGTAGDLLDEVLAALPVPAPPEQGNGGASAAREDLETGITAWGLALEACAAWRADDRDRMVDAVTTFLADARLAPYGIHALCNVVDGLLLTLSGLTRRSREELWAPYAAVPARMRAELLGLDRPDVTTPSPRQPDSHRFTSRSAIEVFRNEHGVLVRWDGAAGFVAVLDTGVADGRVIERFHAVGPVTREQAEAEASRWWERQLAHNQEDDDRIAANDLAYRAVEEYIRDNKHEYLRLLDSIMDNHAYTCWAVIALMGTTANVVQELGGLDADGWASMADFLRTHDRSWPAIDIAHQAAAKEPE